MLVFPNCKINLGLHILDKREDGFHNLETIFYPLSFNDALEIIQTSDSQIQFTNSGLIAEKNEEDNICVKAYHLLKKDFPRLPAVKMHLHKRVPIGAGLGGGSADASFTLKTLNEKFQLGLTTSKLIDYSLQLGSDCPFFIINKPCIAGGRGEILEEIKIDLSSYQIMLITPGIHINTGWAFSQLNNFSSKKTIKEIITQPIETWSKNLQNDFEEPVFKKYPEIEEVKKNLYAQGAIYSSMSGSGSSVFGLFEKKAVVRNNFPDNYFVTILSL